MERLKRAGRQAGRQAPGILGDGRRGGVGGWRAEGERVATAAAVVSEAKKTTAPATGEENTSRLWQKTQSGCWENGEEVGVWGGRGLLT